jgi:hypothetical protein
VSLGAGAGEMERKITRNQMGLYGFVFSPTSDSGCMMVMQNPLLDCGLALM